MQETMKEILMRVDHTLLRQTATWEEIRKICEEGIAFQTASVCIPPSYVKQAKEFVGERLPICTVIGFPNGNCTTAVKVFETEDAIRNGADEIDMVVCISAIKNGDYGYVKKEIKKVVKAARGCPVKAIIETSLLTQSEMIKAAECARDAGAAYVKTSTGYFGSGAKAEDVRLLKQTVKGVCLVKASGGIKNADQFKEMVDAGADRIGTSSGIEIAEGIKKQER